MRLTKLIFYIPFACMFMSAHYDRLAYTIAFGILAICFLMLRVGGDLLCVLVSALEEDDNGDN